jgi:hypothetical protein
MFRVHAISDTGLAAIWNKLPDLFAASFFLGVAAVLFAGVIGMVGEFGSAYAIAAPASPTLARAPSAAQGSVAMGSFDCRAAGAEAKRRT